MDALKSKLRLAYYDSIDGPRILISGFPGGSFSELKRLFFELGRQPEGSCQLETQEFIEAVGGIEIALCCWGPPFPRRSNTYPLLRRVMGFASPKFNWCYPAKRWKSMAQSLDTLIGRQTAGHIYLTSYPAESAIVVASKGEYDSDVLSQI
jgi:hypothetical protein